MSLWKYRVGAEVTLLCRKECRVLLCPSLPCTRTGTNEISKQRHTGSHKTVEKQSREEGLALEGLPSGRLRVECRERVHPGELPCEQVVRVRKAVLPPQELQGCSSPSRGRECGGLGIPSAFSWETDHTGPSPHLSAICSWSPHSTAAVDVGRHERPSQPSPLEKLF